MRVCIDGQSLLTKRTGIGNYTYNLIDKISLNNHPYDVSVFANSMRGNLVQEFQNTTIDFKLTRFPYKIYKKCVYDYNINIGLFAGSFDLFHSTNFIAPKIGKNKKLVITVHDLAFKYFPEMIEKETLNLINEYLPRSLERANKVIAVSENTKKDLITNYSIDPNKIVVTPLACNREQYQRVSNEEKIAVVKTKYNILNDYFIYIGTLEPRKNIPNLIKAFNKVANTYENISLVLVGQKGWGYEEISKLINEFNLEDRIIFTGYVPDEEIPALLSGSISFVYPSFYEGFGLPVLEAFSCGVPVITSNNSSLPEVAGELGVYVDPYNVDDLANKLNKMLEEKHNLDSKKYIERAKQFSWESLAEKTSDVYMKLLYK